MPYVTTVHLSGRADVLTGMRVLGAKTGVRFNFQSMSPTRSCLPHFLRCRCGYCLHESRILGAQMCRKIETTVPDVDMCFLDHFKRCRYDFCLTGSGLLGAQHSFEIGIAVPDCVFVSSQYLNADKGMCAVWIRPYCQTHPCWFFTVSLIKPP